MELSNLIEEMAKLKEERNQALHDLENYKIEHEKKSNTDDKKKESEIRLKQIILLLDKASKEISDSEQEKYQTAEKLTVVTKELEELKEKYKKVKSEKDYFENETIKLNNTKIIKATRKYWKYLNKKRGV